MNDAAFIIGLMRTETDTLGFIPSTAIRSRWIPNGRYILARDRRGRRQGYLLHGPMHPGRPCHINQVCLAYNHRRRRHATAAIDQLIARASISGASGIILRCAADLQANHFWLAAGFTPMAINPGGKRRNRRIVTYTMQLDSTPKLNRTPHLYQIRWPSKVASTSKRPLEAILGPR